MKVKYTVYNTQTGEIRQAGRSARRVVGLRANEAVLWGVRGRVSDQKVNLQTLELEDKP